eukprot:scaffold73_cov252-Pinguiococcus_pyrenoidosus.AAC.7
MTTVFAGLFCLMVASFLSSDDRYRANRRSNLVITIPVMIGFVGYLCSAVSAGRSHRHRAQASLRVANELCTVLGSLLGAWYTLLFETLQLGPSIRPLGVFGVCAAVAVSGLDVFEMTLERFQMVVRIRVCGLFIAVLTNLIGLVDYEMQDTETAEAFCGLFLATFVCVLAAVAIILTEAGSCESRWLPFRAERLVLKIRDATLGNLLCLPESSSIVWIVSAHKLFVAKCCVDPETGDVSVLNGLHSEEGSHKPDEQLRSWFRQQGLVSVLPVRGSHSDLEPAIQTASNIKSSLWAMLLYLTCVLVYLYYGTNAPLAFAAVASGAMTFTSSTMWGWCLHGTAGGVKVREADTLRSLMLLLAPAIDLAIPYDTTHFERSFIALAVWAIILDGLWTILRLSEQNDTILFLKKGTDVFGVGGNSPDFMHGVFALGDARLATISTRSMGRMDIYQVAVPSDAFPFKHARLFT